MSLSAEFFSIQEQASLNYKKQGETDLDEFLEQHGLKIDYLVNAKILQEKATQSTADLSPYEVSKMGWHYLREIKRYQLVFVKAGKGSELLAKIIYRTDPV